LDTKYYSFEIKDESKELLYISSPIEGHFREKKNIVGVVNGVATRQFKVGPEQSYLL
ncbi:4817_t:CDS:1, partial [Dentiscutata erythropus]